MRNRFSNFLFFSSPIIDRIERIKSLLKKKKHDCQSIIRVAKLEATTTSRYAMLSFFFLFFNKISITGCLYLVGVQHLSVQREIRCPSILSTGWQVQHPSFTAPTNPPLPPQPLRGSDSVLATNRPTKFLESQPDFRSFLFSPPLHFSFRRSAATKLNHPRNFRPGSSSPYFVINVPLFLNPSLLPFLLLSSFFDTVLLLRKSFHSLKLGSNVWSDRARVYTRFHDYYFPSKCCDNVVIIGVDRIGIKIKYML